MLLIPTVVIEDKSTSDNNELFFGSTPSQEHQAERFRVAGSAIYLKSSKPLMLILLASDLVHQKKTKIGSMIKVINLRSGLIQNALWLNTMVLWSQKSRVTPQESQSSSMTVGY
jgi:hypothetical protein